MRTRIKIKIITVGFAAAAALVSCSSDDPVTPTTQVNFTAEISGETAVSNSRAAGTDWSDADRIGIFMVQGSSEVAVNKEFKVSNPATGTLEPNSEADVIYYPQTEGTVDFIAYYPYAGTATLGGDIMVTLGDQAQQPSFDLLYSNDARGKDENTPMVDLRFEHKLSKLIMNVTTGDGLTDADLVGMTVRIRGMNTRNTFNLTTGLLGSSDTPANITPRELTPEQGFAASYDAIIMPSAAIQNNGDYYVEFTIAPNGAAEVFPWNMDAGTLFQDGHKYTYEVTIARTGVSAKGTVTPWVTGGSNDRPGVTAE